MSAAIAETKPTKVVIQSGGKDYHGAGCDCGKCNSNGHAYECRVYDVSDWPDNAVEDGEVLDEYLDQLADYDPCFVDYAPGEDAAWQNCRTYCEQQQWIIL